jgi:hypothetical protein
MSKRTINARRAILAAAIGTVMTALSPATRAQVTPAAGYVPPDDTPSVKVGVTIFADYTYADSPKATNADGSTYNPNQFNLGRSYVNVTGQFSHLLSFRITTDLTRETGTGSSLNGSYTIRMKYGFAQLNLDDSLPKGSWVRFGLQQTPYIDYEEGVYRYRFQSPTFVDRDGYLPSSDLGLSGHLSLPDNYGDVHLGVYNGEGYNHPEVNDQKSVQIRASFRPAPSVPVLKGWRLTVYYDADHAASNQDRKRLIGETTFESSFLNAGFSYLQPKDQASPGAVEVTGQEYSVWATPRTSFGLEALIRFDQLKKNKDIDSKTDRFIAGIAYWFDFTHGHNSAVMLDFDQETYPGAAPAKVTVTKYALHTLFNW